MSALSLGDYRYPTPMLPSPLPAQPIHMTVLALTGLGLGAAFILRPGFGQGAIHPLFVLVLVSLLVEGLLAIVAQRRPVVPLSGNARAIGFFLGAMLYLGMGLLFGPASTPT